jgi:adenylate cyclase
MAEERVQRRLAAILAADVVGYSRLMEQDEAGTLARLQLIRAEILDPRIAEHGGRIVKTMGDGVLVEFPSAVAAVESALANQQEIIEHESTQPEERRIQFRVGINLGDVIIEDDDIHGDGVNVAARLEGLCRPGEVYISATVHDHVDGKLSAHFDDLGDQTVKNIARPVRVYRARGMVSDPIKQESAETSPLPDKPSIAVLPFQNMSGDPEQEYFSDGITEDIITALAHLSGLNVLARNTSFAFKGKAIDVREARRDFGVSHVIEGSVRRSGNQLRITAQLIDTATGHHVWAERYDRDLTDVFAVQDEITANIVSALDAELIHGEWARRWRADTRNVDAWLHGIQARGAFVLLAPSAHQAAKRHLEQAIAIDPNYAIALAHLAWIDAVAAGISEPGEKEAVIARAMDWCDKAEALDPTIAMTQLARGIVHLAMGEHDSAVAAGQRAVELEDSGYCYSVLSRFLKDAGKTEEAFRAITRAIHLSPAMLPPYLWFLGDIYRLMGRKDDAIRTFRQLSESAPDSWQAPLFLAVLYQDDNRTKEARGQIDALLRVAPNFTVRRFVGFASYSDGSIAAEMAQHLREAGLPD